MRSLVTHQDHNFLMLRFLITILFNNNVETWENSVNRMVIMNFLSSQIFFSTAANKSSVVTDGRSEYSSLWIFSWPPLNSNPFLYFTFCHCFSAINFSYLAVDMFLEIKKSITNHITHTADGSIILNMLKTCSEVYTLVTKLQVARVSSQRMLVSGTAAA